MSKIYTQRTASLRATTIDAQTLDTRNISIYPGEGGYDVRKNLLTLIKEKDDALNETISSLSFTLSENIAATDSRLVKVEEDIIRLNESVNNGGGGDSVDGNLASRFEEFMSKNFAYLDSSNAFNADNTFNAKVTFKTGNYNISIDDNGLNSYYPLTSEMGFSSEGTLTIGSLDTQTALGEDAYTLKASKAEGVQLCGTHFIQGDKWSENALKIVHNELALFGDAAHPCSLTFDNANVVNFRVMPEDGSAANDSQGAIFDFSTWEWDNDGHTTMNSNCPVQILKNNSGSLVDRSVLNLSESDSRYSQLHSENILTETNTFEKTIIAEDGVYVTGDVFVSEGVLTFEDLVDGTVVKRSGASGYQYIPKMPVNFENGVCYDIGEISNTTNLSNVKFTGEGTLVQTCELWFTTPATPPTAHQWPTNIYWIDSDTGAAPTLLASKNYRLVFRQEPNKIIASIAYLY